MVCNKCGHEIDDSATFCTFCGNNITKENTKILIIKISAMVIIAMDIANILLNLFTLVFNLDFIKSNGFLVDYIISTISYIVTAIIYLMIVLNKTVQLKKLTIILISLLFTITFVSPLINIFRDNIVKEIVVSSIFSCILSVLSPWLIIMVGIIKNKSLEKYAAICFFIIGCFSMVFNIHNTIKLNYSFAIISFIFSVIPYITAILQVLILLLYPVFTKMQPSLKHIRKKCR